MGWRQLFSSPFWVLLLTMSYTSNNYNNNNNNKDSRNGRSLVNGENFQLQHAIHPRDARLRHRRRQNHDRTRKLQQKMFLPALTDESSTSSTATETETAKIRQLRVERYPPSSASPPRNKQYSPPPAPNPSSLRGGRTSQNQKNNSKNGGQKGSGRPKGGGKGGNGNGGYNKSSKKKSSKKHSKSKSGTPRPPPPLRPRPAQPPSISDGSDCFVPISVTFLQFPAVSVDNVNPIFIDYNSPNAQDLGTTYVYNDSLVDETTVTELEDSFVTGVCTRTQMRESMDGNGDGDGDNDDNIGNNNTTTTTTPSNNFVSGGGYCHFTYTLAFSLEVEGEGESPNFSFYTLDVAGEVFDSFGGVLAVTGGTNGLVGVTGQVQLTPFEITEEGDIVQSEEDFFTGAEIYRADATLYRNICLIPTAF